MTSFPKFLSTFTIQFPQPFLTLQIASSEGRAGGGGGGVCGEGAPASLVAVFYLDGLVRQTDIITSPSPSQKPKHSFSAVEKWGY